MVVNVKTFMTKNQNSEGFYFLDTHNSSIPALSNAFIMFYTCSNRCVDCFCNENLDSHTCIRTIPQSSQNNSDTLPIFLRVMTLLS